ncbi:hypothetical protein [Drosophila suzukii associated hytrosavirus 1]|nr:hypothetical protein [Drosophila suzukii associated hytrosavirus 1]
MERGLFKTLDLDFRISKIKKKFVLSESFERIHNNYVELFSRDTFTLSPDIMVKRKDQLLLNLQFNNLFHSYNMYTYQDYCRYAEEFFTYFLNYEIITGICSPQFPKIIRSIFERLELYAKQQAIK